MRFLPATLLCLALPCAWPDEGADSSFDRYKIIIERSPFRKGSATSAAPVITQSFDGIQLMGVFVGDGVKKAFLLDSRNQQRYYVSEGETFEGGIKVVEISAENQTVKLERGIETHVLAFPKTPSPTATAQAAPGYRGLRTPPPAPLPAAVTTGTSATPQAASPTSLRRRILRQNIKPAIPPAEVQAANPSPATQQKPAPENPEARADTRAGEKAEAEEPTDSAATE